MLSAITDPKTGAFIVITGRSANPLTNLENALHIIKKEGGEAVYVQGDVSKSADAEKMVK